MSKKLEGLKYMLCSELESYADRGGINGSDLEAIYKLSGAAKRIACMIEMEDDYSRQGSYDGGYRRSYRSYDDGMSSRRDYRGRYARHGSMRERMKEMLNETSDPREREQIQRFMEDMDR